MAKKKAKKKKNTAKTKKAATKKTTCSQVNNRTEKGRFPKGVSGNPSGRPLSKWRDELEVAIKTVQRKKQKKFMVHAIEQAYKNPNVLIALLKKLLPDLKTEEIDAGADLKTFIDWLIGRDGNPKNKG